MNIATDYAAIPELPIRRADAEPRNARLGRVRFIRFLASLFLRALHTHEDLRTH